MTGIDVKHIPYRGTPARGRRLAARAKSTTASNWRTRCMARCRPAVETARGRLAGALADHSRCADGRGIGRARVFGRGLVRLGLSRRHAAGDRRQDQCRVEGGAGAARRSASNSSKGGRRGRISRRRRNSASISTTKSPNGNRCATRPGFNRNRSRGIVISGRIKRNEMADQLNVLVICGSLRKGSSMPR